MAFVVYISMAWVIIACLVATPKIRKSDNAFLFLLSLLYLCNGSWIIIEEMEKVILSKELDKYLAFLILRTVIIPVGILVCENRRFTDQGYRATITYYLLFYSTLSILEWSAVKLKLYEYQGWSWLLSIFGYIVIHILVLLTWKWFRHYTRDEVNQGGLL